MIKKREKRSKETKDYIKQLKKNETVKNVSYKRAYACCNMLREAYLQSEKSREMKCTYATVDYFDRKLDAIAQYVQEVKNDFFTKKENAMTKNNEVVERMKATCFSHFCKVYKDANFKNMDEIINFELGIINYEPLEEDLISAFQDESSVKKIGFSNFLVQYYALLQVMSEVNNSKIYYENIEALFNQTNKYGRNIIFDDIERMGKPLPTAYKGSENTYFVSMKLLDNFRVRAHSVDKYMVKTLKAETRKNGILNVALEKALKQTNNDENNEWVQNLRAEVTKSNNTLIDVKHYADVSRTMKNVLDILEKRKDGIDTTKLPTEVILNNIINNALLTLLTTDKISSITSTMVPKHTHIIVHEKEIEELLEDGKELYETLMPTLELAYALDKYIYIPVEDTDKSVSIVKYLLDVNLEKIEDKVDELAKQERTTLDKKWEELSEEELVSFGYNPEIFRHIVYLTNNGNFVFDGNNLYNAKTNEKVEMENIEEIDKIFGLEEAHEQKVQGVLTNLQSALDEEFKDGKPESEEEYNERVKKVVEGLGYTINFTTDDSEVTPEYKITIGSDDAGVEKVNNSDDTPVDDDGME